MNIGNIFMSMMNDCRGFENQIQSTVAKLKFVEIINSKSKDDSYHYVKEEIKFQDLMREYFTLHLLANYQIICENNITRV